MEGWFAVIPSIISAVGAIVAGWFAYNQYTKNKMTDVKVERWKTENERTNKRRADNSTLVYGELWEVLHTLQADRVYIIQPHPLGNESMVSVFYESKRKGIESMKPRIRHLKMSEIAKFCVSLAKNKFMYIQNIDAEIEDKYAHAILSSCGTNKVLIRQLSSSSYDWVGSILCEFTHESDIDIELAEATLKEAAINIQYILPEYNDD